MAYTIAVCVVSILQVHVDEWRVEVQESERAQDLLKLHREATPSPNVARLATLR